MKKTLLRDLKNEFLEFIEALEIYFYEFVEKASDVHPISQIIYGMFFIAIIFLTKHV